MRSDAQSRAALIALSSALAACNHDARPPIEATHTISTDSAAQSSTAADAISAAQTVNVIVDAESFDAVAALIDAQRSGDARPTQSDRVSDNPFAGLGLTGVGAAYGASPVDPMGWGIGRGRRVEVTITRMEPANPRLRAFLLARRSSLAGCYARALHTNPSLGGGLDAQLTLAANGAVSSVVVRSSELPVSLTTCAQSQLARTRVAPGLASPGPLSVHYVFTTLTAER